MNFFLLYQNDEPIDVEIAKTVEPRLAMSGNLSSLDPIYIAAEGI